MTAARPINRTPMNTTIGAAASPDLGKALVSFLPSLGATLRLDEGLVSGLATFLSFSGSFGSLPKGFVSLEWRSDSLSLLPVLI